MTDEANDILSGDSEKSIGQKKLLQYLDRTLPETEQHEFEKQMTDDEFMNDAVEGLQALKQTKDIPAYIDELNATLKAQLEKKKKRKEKRKLPSQYWTYVTVVLFILLIIVAFFIIRRIG